MACLSLFKSFKCHFWKRVISSDFHVAENMWGVAVVRCGLGLWGVRALQRRGAPAFLQCECTDCWVLVYPQYFPHNNCAIFSPCHTLTQWTCQHSGSCLNSALCVLCLNISDISDLEKHLRNQRNTKQLKWSFHQQAVCILVSDLWTIANIQV